MLRAWLDRVPLYLDNINDHPNLNYSLSPPLSLYSGSESSEPDEPLSLCAAAASWSLFFFPRLIRRKSLLTDAVCLSSFTFFSRRGLPTNQTRYPEKAYVVSATRMIVVMNDVFWWGLFQSKTLSAYRVWGMEGIGAGGLVRGGKEARVLGTGTYGYEAQVKVKDGNHCENNDVVVELFRLGGFADGGGREELASFASLCGQLHGIF